MEPRVHVITLAVDNLERALAFYRSLGFESSGIVAGDLTDDATGANGAIAPFILEGGLMLSLYPRSELAKDAGISSGPNQSGEFSLGHIVRSREEVDTILAKAKASGAPVTEVHDRPWGIYSGYFRDPDGHLWEVIHSPNMRPPSASGR